MTDIIFSNTERKENNDKTSGNCRIVKNALHILRKDRTGEKKVVEVLMRTLATERTHGKSIVFAAVIS